MNGPEIGRGPIVGLAAWLAAMYGLELGYPPRDDPPVEPRSTLANDGRPCAPWPDDGEGFHLGDPS